MTGQLDFDSFFQKVPVFTPPKLTVDSGEHFEATVKVPVTLGCTDYDWDLTMFSWRFIIHQSRPILATSPLCTSDLNFSTQQQVVGK
jgi:hypothetical protein